MNNVLVWAVELLVPLLAVLYLFILPLYRARQMRKLADELGLSYRFSDQSQDFSFREYFGHGVHYMNILRGTINLFQVEIADRVVTTHVFRLDSGPRYRETDIKINGFEHSLTSPRFLYVGIGQIRMEVLRLTNKGKARDLT